MKNKIQIKLFNRILVLLILNFLMLSGLWAIDIGASALIMGAEVEGLTGIRSGNTQYHLGLGLCVLSFLTLSFLYLKKLCKEV